MRARADAAASQFFGFIILSRMRSFRKPISVLVCREARLLPGLPCREIIAAFLHPGRGRPACSVLRHRGGVAVADLADGGGVGDTDLTGGEGVVVGIKPA